MLTYLQEVILKFLHCDGKSLACNGGSKDCYFGETITEKLLFDAPRDHREAAKFFCQFYLGIDAMDGVCHTKFSK